jgi:hypothetical protein
MHRGAVIVAAGDQGRGVGEQAGHHDHGRVGVYAPQESAGVAVNQNHRGIQGPRCHKASPHVKAKDGVFKGMQVVFHRAGPQVQHLEAPVHVSNRGHACPCLQ